MSAFISFKKMLAILFLACAASFQGAWAQKTITIGSSSKADHPFSEFDSLLTEVAAGNLTGQITFAFEAGTYTFTKALNVNTAKFTAKDHLTITSVDRNRDSVTFRYSTSTVIPGFILLNNTKHVTFSHLYIHNNSTSGGHTVCVNGPIEDVTFYHCYIKRTSGANFATSGTMQTIGATTLNNTTAQDNNNGNNGPATTIKWLRYIGNTIDNGCRNIITIATTNRIQGLVFNENTILDNTAAGIIIYRADSVTCNRNHVMVKDKTSSYWSPGIQLSAITGDSVCGNFVSFMNQTGSYYGGSAINVSGVVNTKTGIGKSGRILIANNVILGYNNSAYTKNNAGSCSVLSFSKVQADVWFNSVYNARTSYAPTNANNNKTVYVLGVNDTCDIHLAGNQLIAFNDKNQHVMNIAAGTVAAGKIVSEYNNFHFMYGGSTYAYQNGTAISSFANLMTFLGDKTSLSLAPVFTDSTKGLELDNPTPFSIVPNPGMAADFLGNPRGKTTTIGAYGAAASGPKNYIVIGNSPKADHPYSALDSLLKEVSAGSLTGPITFAFESGTYTLSKTLVINTANFSDTDHLTITSVAQHQDSVIFKYSGSVAALRLENTNNVTFSHVTFSSSTTSSCHCVGVTGPVSNVLFHHSKIMAPETGTAGSCCPIGTASATAATDKGNIAAAVDRLHFVGNTISGGCRTIFLNGSSTNHLTNIRVDSNQIVMGYDQDLNLAYCDTLSVQMNRISPRPGINQNHQGVTISNCAVESICRNFINFNDVTYSAPTGLVLNINNCTPASGKRFLIANNVVIGKVAVGYNSSIGNVVTLNNNQADFFHNSILNNRVTTNTTYSVNCLNLTGASSDIQAIGNQLVTIDRNEFPLRIDASITTYFTDYNNYWSDSGNVARDGSSSYATVAALQAVTSGDKYSVSIAPQFADLAQGLQISNFPAFAIVPNLGVNTDYQGVPRGKTSIIGAYTAASLDAALTDYAKTDFSANQSGVNDLYVTLQNAGLDTLTAATIFWNDGTMQKYPWSGKLTPGAVDTVKIGQFKPVAGSFYHVRAWVADPNNGQDGFNGNDTIETTQFVCKGALAGDYAIGKGLDFANLDEAFIALKACGISAPVRLMLTAGTYNPLTISGTITGASSKNTVTLMPYKNDEVIFDGGSAGASLIVENTAHWIFEGLTIGNTKDGLRGVDLLGSTEDILFHSCNIYANNTASGSTYRCVNLPNTSSTTTYPVDVRFISNVIKGGYYNFYLYYMGGNDANNITKTHMVIDSNIMADAYYYGIYAYYRAGFESVSHNTITNRSGSSNVYYGIYGTNYCVWNKVEGNRIHVNNTSSGYGFYGTSYQQPATYTKQPAYLCNNEIHLSGSSAKYGIEILTPNGNWEVHHNTICIEGSSSTTYGFCHSNSSSSYKVNFTRNMVYCSGYSSSYPVYIATAANGNANMGVRAYNNLYAPTYAGYIGATKATVADLMTASTNNDSNSLKTLPVFTNPKVDLKLSNITNFLCPTDGSLPMEDIEGTQRNKISTLMGAYTFVNLDAALLDFGNTSHYADKSGAINLYVTLMNAGMDTLTTATIIWDDGTMQKYAWKGTLAPGAIDTVNIGQLKAANNTMYHIKAWVTDPNNKKDGFAGNDTIKTDHYSCGKPFAGDYTIGPKGDFTTINEAIARLQDCGIDKPVRLMVMAGKYDALTIGAISGTDSKNTITLMPYKNNDVVIIDGGAAGASLTLENAAHWIFEGLTIGNTTDGLRSVDLLGSTEDILFHGCNIYANKTASSNSYRCVNLPNTSSTITYPVDVRFIGNEVRGGYYNFYLYYMGGNDAANITKTHMVIDSNIMADAYYYGIYAYYRAGFESVSHNTVTNRSGSSNVYYGIYGTSYCLWNKVEGNRIHVNNTSSGYGFYGTSYQQPATYTNQPAYLCNNEIYLSGSSAKYGIEILTPNGNWEVHHNTVFIEGSSSTTYGFCHSNSSSSYKVNFTRNMVYCSGYSSSYPVYIATAANGNANMGVRAYNNLYAPTYAGYIGAAKATVSDLMTASTNNDSNTLSVKPVFNDVKVDLTLGNDTSFKCPNYAAIVPTDINAKKRASVTVMGAYHSLSSTLPANDAMLAGFHNLNKIFAGKSPVSVIITNNGSTEIKQATINCSINGVYQTGLYYQPAKPLGSLKSDTVEIGKYNFQLGSNTLTAWVDLTGDSDHSNDTISTKLNAIAKEDVVMVDFANTQLTGGQSSKVYVTMVNKGVDTLKSVEIQWTFNNTQQTAYQWKGALKAGDSATFAIGSAVPTANRFIKLAAWSVNPNGLLDGNLNNDTIRTTLYACGAPMSGTYTVASNGGARTNFANVSEALQAVQTCGVSGAVTFSIGMSHTVKQLVIIDSIPGSSSSNTISFVPDYGVVVTVNNEADGPSLILENTMYWSFSNFVFGDSIKGLTGLQMKGSNKHIAFDHCTFHASESATQSNSNAVEFANKEKSGNYPVNINFSNCRINGGFANFYFTYMASDPKRMDPASVHIKQCTLTDGFQYGLYSQGCGAIKTFSQNLITNRPKCKDYTAVHSESYAVWDKIERNIIHLNNAGAAYGFYMIKGNQDATYTSKAAYMTNNEIRIIGDGSTQCGIYQYEPNGNWEIHHNSIYAQANGKGSNAHGLELHNSNSKCKINASRNLVFTDASISYPLFIDNASYCDATYGTREWNNFYSRSNVAYIGSAVTSITQLQSLTKQDANSMNTAPSYKNISTNLELNDYYAFSCRSDKNVPIDINGKNRTKLTPMGCYSIDIFETTNLKIAEVISPKAVNSAVCYGEKMPVSIIMQNSGIKALSYDTASLKVSVDVTGAATFHTDTTLLKGGIGAKAFDTLRIGEFKTLVDGIYQVKITLSCKADDTTSDNEASISYKMYRIGLPYDVDFTTEPKELVTRTVSGNAQWSVNSSTGTAPVYGKGTLLMNGMGNKGSVTEAVFNGIHIDGYTQPKLSFWYAHSAGKDQGDSTIVKATTDGGATYTVLGRLSAVANTAGWKQYDYDLSKYATAPCLSIVFEGKAGGNTQQIDRIRLSALQDAAIALLPTDLSNLTACDNQPITVKAVVTNQTMQPIKLTNDTIRLQVTGALTATTRYVYSNTLAGLAADTITIGQIASSGNGFYYMELSMQPQDDVAANDVVRDSSLYIYRDLMIDNCTGIDTQTARTAGELVPVTATITNKGNLLADRYFVQLKVNGQSAVIDTVTTALKAGETGKHVISFNVPFATKAHPLYDIEVIATTGCDADLSNDTFRMAGKVNVPDTTDIQLLDISHSVTSLVGNGSVAPTVRISNNGNSTADQMTLHVVVIDKNNQQLVTLSETVSGLTAGESRNVAFTQKYTVPNYTGTYQLMAYVDALAADPVRSNDTLTKPFECTVGIRNVEQLDWSLGQNIPNPAGNVTVLPFTLPQEGMVHISVMTANGQVIYRQELQGEAGGNRLELNTSDWASGLYYYSMEYRGQRITRKMNIAR